MIKLFTLISGKEVIGTVKNETDSTVSLKYPMHIQLIQQSADTYGLGLYPYSPSNPEGVHEFNASLIQSSSTDVPKDLEENYIRETSGISIVSTLR